tara:strand:- start:1939 stop:2217 length:279 start_codon:yes stop_codon:yes gene_type:complete
MVKKTSPRQLAERWGIAYIVDASNHDVWKETFMALGTATHYLDHKEEEIEKLFNELTALREDIDVYTNAIEIASKKHNFNVEELLLEAEKTI